MVCNHSIIGPSKTIETNSCLTPKPSKNHWTQWLPQTIPFNGDGAFENHWNFALVAKCGPKSPNKMLMIIVLDCKYLNLLWQQGKYFQSTQILIKHWWYIHNNHNRKTIESESEKLQIGIQFIGVRENWAKFSQTLTNLWEFGSNTTEWRIWVESGPVAKFTITNLNKNFVNTGRDRVAVLGNYFINFCVIFKRLLPFQMHRSIGTLICFNLEVFFPLKFLNC